MPKDLYSKRSLELAKFNNYETKVEETKRLAGGYRSVLKQQSELRY